MSGWIKLHRKMLENAVFYKADYYQIWSYILLKVNFENNEFIWNDERKLVEKGSGIFSQKKMADIFGFEISKINRILKFLENEKQIEIKSTNKFTEIKVLNWSEYQEALENGNQIETKIKPKGKQKETIKKDNNENNEEEILFEAFRVLYPGKKLGLSTEFGNFIKKHSDWKEVLPILIGKLNNQIATRSEKIRLGAWVPEWKNLKTWINQKCWEETDSPPQVIKSQKPNGPGRAIV